MEPRDADDLKRAVKLLENPGLSIRVINLLGYPIEGIIKSLPKWAGQSIGHMATRAVVTALHVALSTLDRKNPGKAFRWTHRAMVVVSGAIGGFEILHDNQGHRLRCDRAAVGISTGRSDIQSGPENIA